ncbi:MAG: hypothetical protein ABNH03_14515 [Alteromonas sp.]|jgi:hypothetical protein|uniref:hypothetical protein n=1 Tax=Alteromonas sp. TaxID=232 RepID=UPI000B6425F6|nr:MAG: hypothetical protein CBB95_17280 [Alteromonas sp. TMED35]|tara:strand:+ start:92 stop:427 length:336 start_codon:yes stop_codon:yes gene_type:complete
MNKMQTTAEDLIKLYESKESILDIVFNAFRRSRKVGFRLYRYEVSPELNEYYAALFCFSLIDNTVFDSLIASDEPEKIKHVQSAISSSMLLRSHVEFVLSYSPVIDWDAGK